MKHFKIAMVGSGPANTMAAIKLIKNGIKDIVIIEKGKYRTDSPEESVTEGIFGASLRSDGKLNYHHNVGTSTLPDIVGLKRYYEYLTEQEKTWLEFAPTKNQVIKYFGSEDGDNKIHRYEPTIEAKQFRAKSLAHDLELSTYPILHIGSDNGYLICENLYHYLLNNNITMLPQCNVFQINKENNIFTISYRNKDDEIEIVTSDYVVVGTGRTGASAFKGFMEHLNIPVEPGAVDLGCRIECAEEVTSKLIDCQIYEPKFMMNSPTWDDRVRSFCWNYKGEVVKEVYPHSGLITANGHSRAHSKTNNTNFALLVTKSFAPPFDDALGYIEGICEQTNRLSDKRGLIIQRFGDLLNGRRTTDKRLAEGGVIPSCDAYPGDGSIIMPARFLSSIVDMLKAMDNVLPGIGSKFTLLYFTEAKFYTNRVQINEYGETMLSKLYAIGDCSHTRGLNASSVMGLMAANGIVNSLK